MDAKELKEIHSKIIEVLRNKESFLITSHLRPDGDAIGSQLALASLLEEMGKSIIIVNVDPVPDPFRFLPESDRITNDFIPEDPPEVALVLDTSSLDRTGRVAGLVRKAKLVINIDHHISNEKFGDINLIEEDAGAVGEQIFSLIRSLDCPIGKKRAVSLYTAILTDTGAFQYDNTTEKTHRIARHLLREGVEPALITEKIYQNVSFSRQKLLGLALATLRRNPREGVGWIRLTREMYRKAEAKDSETDGFINYVRSIKGIRLALLFQETDKKNQVRVSFRSSREINVNDLAQQFGGGGHPRAAGCTVEGDIEEVENKVLAAARKIIVTS
ncbi:MAG: bifunctional oligoribonuclease/PAP phosphatase NrnA [Nitrospirae bacterium]|nr:bifunctional oligoribonuclease/PAP phosphatase NrnA [Nitrospirota bacterium]